MPTFKETFAPSHIGWPKALFYVFATTASVYYMIQDYREIRRMDKEIKALEDPQK